MEKNIDRIKKEVGLKLGNIARRIYLKDSICNIGKIVEEEDRIICYVDQKSLESFDKCKGKRYFYELKLNGVNQVTDGIKEITENFNLNKPVYYIFDGIKFDMKVRISSMWANIIFKNCTFNRDIIITMGDKITFENNKYEVDMPIYYSCNGFFTANYVNKITFINENFKNTSDDVDITNFGMEIEAKTIEFNNTKVDTSTGTINIKAEKTVIQNSTFSVKDAYIDSQSIESIGCLIKTKKGLIIENKHCDFDGNVESPTAFYNGVDMAQNNKTDIYAINEEKAKLKETRQKFVEELHNLSDYFQQLNDNKIQDVIEKANNENRVRTFKKN